MSITGGRTRLRDGAWIEIRPIEPADREGLREGFERLSAESRYRRFFGPMHELSERDLNYLTQVDHHDHEALVAADAATGVGIGVARYVRTAPVVAEPAIVVADDWQGRGVASALLRALAERARSEGIQRFEAPVLATNQDAVRVLERLGETAKVRNGREIQLTITLPSETEPSFAWGRLLRQFATGALEPARTLLERVWPRRPGSPDDVRLNVIVVGTDGSPPARLAVETAAQLALLSSAQIEVVGAHRFLSAERSALEEAVRAAAVSLRERGIATHEQLRRGDPALVLTDIAAELRARLIVVGGGTVSRGARRVLGGVSDYVAERSPCNVLIVREREPV